MKFVTPSTRQFASSIRHLRAPLLLAAMGVALVPSLARAGISAGGQNDCLAVRPDGTVVAWGHNGNGQTTVPIGLNNVVSVNSAWSHSLALRADGTVASWGQLLQSTVPAGLNTAIAVSGGNGSSFALRSDGTVLAWGYNSYGNTVVPAGLNNAVAISAGMFHSLALRADGTLAAWGRNSEGQATIPAGLNNVVAVTGGYLHSVAARADGTVSAWGYNYYGQATVPSGINNAVAVSAGHHHSLALRADGTVAAWGHSYYTQVPTGLTNVVSVDAGENHSLALLSDGSLALWGYTGHGLTPLPSGPFGAPSVYWKSAVSGNYLASQNWKYGTPSTAVSDAIYNPTGTYNVNFTSDARADDIDINAGNVTFNLNSRTYRAQNTATIATAASLTLNGGTLQSPTLDNYGTLKGIGTVTGLVSNYGTLAPGTSVGELHVEGNLALASTSVTQMQIGGPGVGLADKVSVTGYLIYDGALDVEFVSSPAAGTSFQLFTFTSHTGEFDSVSIGGVESMPFLLTLGSSGWSGTREGLSFFFDSGAGTLSMDLSAVPEPLTAAAVLFLAGRVLGRRTRGSL